jgi:hypothetical protein
MKHLEAETGDLDELYPHKRKCAEDVYTFPAHFPTIEVPNMDH